MQRRKVTSTQTSSKQIVAPGLSSMDCAFHHSEATHVPCSEWPQVLHAQKDH